MANQTGPTIREVIMQGEARMLAARLEQLETIQAPTCLLEGVATNLFAARAGTLHIGGDATLLDAPAGTYQSRKGRGGKLFVEFENGTCYFPQARYGRYVSAARNTQA